MQLYTVTIGGLDYTVRMTPAQAKAYPSARPVTLADRVPTVTGPAPKAKPKAKAPANRARKAQADRAKPADGNA